MADSYIVGALESYEKCECGGEEGTWNSFVLPILSYVAEPWRICAGEVSYRRGPCGVS